MELSIFPSTAKHAFQEGQEDSQGPPSRPNPNEERTVSTCVIGACDDTDKVGKKGALHSDQLSQIKYFLNMIIIQQY
jgi:hypothetical protein